MDYKRKSAYLYSLKLPSAPMIPDSHRKLRPPPGLEPSGGAQKEIRTGRLSHSAAANLSESDAWGS